MATETLEMTLIADTDQWTLGAGANKVIAVNSPDDDITSYIYSGTAAQEQKYTVANPSSIRAGDVINFVRSSYRAISENGDPDTITRVNQILGGSENAGDNNLLDGSWTTRTQDWTTKPGGGAWTTADVNSVEFEVELVIAGLADTARCTTMQLIVDYTPSALMGSLPLLGCGK